jgi:protein-tyrosine phosphatase
MLPDTTSLVDIHSHLVPGVDDGARDVTSAVESVEQMTFSGIRRIVTTPHIQASLTHTPHRLEERLSEVTESFQTAAAAVRSTFPEVEFRRGHEVMIDVPEADLSDPRLRLAGTPFVLVEWPRLQVPPGSPRVIREIRDQGYRPIVAHPERYVGLANDPFIVRRWRDAGAYVQVNYGSFVGRYGAEAREAAFTLLEHGLADYLATDFHGNPNLRLYRKEAWTALERRQGRWILEALCRTNPSRMIDGHEPLPVPPLPESGRLIDRLRGAVRRPGRGTAR